MKRILFLCVANSARSQMAEGFARLNRRRLLILHLQSMSRKSTMTRSLLGTCRVGG